MAAFLFIETGSVDIVITHYTFFFFFFCFQKFQELYVFQWKLLVRGGKKEQVISVYLFILCVFSILL